ncbi:hypothetical protein BH23ACT6_BH23ACT6_28160 [soil metagenome]
MWPSAGRRGNAHALFVSLRYLEHLQRTGVPVLNGVRAFRSESSKVTQLGIFEDLDVRTPRTRVVSHTDQFADGEALVAAGAGVEPGIDGTALVQERLTARGDRIVRVEVLGDRVLCAIELDLTPGSFNLRPARDGEAYFYNVNALSNVVADARRILGFDPHEDLADHIVARAAGRQLEATATSRPWVSSSSGRSHRRWRSWMPCRPGHSGGSPGAWTPLPPVHVFATTYPGDPLGTRSHPYGRFCPGGQP